MVKAVGFPAATSILDVGPASVVALQCGSQEELVFLGATQNGVRPAISFGEVDGKPLHLFDANTLTHERVRRLPGEVRLRPVPGALPVPASTLDAHGTLIVHPDGHAFLVVRPASSARVQINLGTGEHGSSAGQPAVGYNEWQLVMVEGVGPQGAETVIVLAEFPPKAT